MSTAKWQNIAGSKNSLSLGGYDLHYNDDIDTENNGTYSSVSTFWSYISWQYRLWSFKLGIQNYQGFNFSIFWNEMIAWLLKMSNFDLNISFWNISIKICPDEKCWVVFFTISSIFIIGALCFVKIGPYFVGSLHSISKYIKELFGTLHFYTKV